MRAHAVRVALALRGTPYRWGGSSPRVGFDCSGLVRYAFAHAGVRLPRNSRVQAHAVHRIPRGALRPGDLVFFGRPIHHVGIYLGGGLMVDAPHTGARVRVEHLWSDLSYAGRIG